jgi:hypothetical protein
LTCEADASSGPGKVFCGFPDAVYLLPYVPVGCAGRLIEAGEVARAALLATESLTLAQVHGNRQFMPNALLAETALWVGELAQTAQWLAHSLAHQPNANRRFVRTEGVDCLFVAARLATAQQHYERAATTFGLAEQMHVQIHYALDATRRPLVEAALATVREAFSTGQRLSLAEAFATLLTPLPTPDSAFPLD